MTLEQDYSEVEKMSPAEILQWAWDNFGKDAVFTSSFGAEDMVIIDMMSKRGIGVPVATIDTGRLHEETYDLMDRVRSEYGLVIESYFPDYSRVEEMVKNHGVNLFYNSVENRKLCCGIRKVEPLNRILKGKRAWITGLRADQTSFRKNASIIEVDAQRGILKINPILGLTSKDVWDYLRKQNVPYNKLHDNGFPSIGCEPCTRAVKPGEGERAGRWWWETDVKECGLHVGSQPSAPEFRISASGTPGSKGAN